MSELQWEIINSQRVLLVSTDQGMCSVGDVHCNFRNRTGVGLSCHAGTVCLRHGDSKMFVTEEQLPDYLTAHLVGGS